MERRLGKCCRFFLRLSERLALQKLVPIMKRGSGTDGFAVLSKSGADLALAEHRAARALGDCPVEQLRGPGPLKVTLPSHTANRRVGSCQML